MSGSSGEMIFDARMNTSGFSKDAGKLGDIVKGLGVFDIVKKGLSKITQSIDAAVSRYDTLNRFPRIMEQMGYGADVAKSSMAKLSDSIQGLPTTLDEIVASTRQFTVATGGLEKGTDSAIALNNAFLASGSSAADASRGMIQYIQMLSSGKVDMMSWRTLNETMTYALQKTAESFGFAGASAKQDLYAALRDGDVTFTEFNDRIIQLNAGVGGFAEVAKTATGGIGTAMTNLGTRTVIGVTAIVEAFDRGLSKTRFQSIENVINSAGTGIKNTLIGVSEVVEFATENIVPLTVGVVAFGAAIKGVQLLALIKQTGSFTAALWKLLPAVVTSTIATAKSAAATALQTAVDAKSTVATGLRTVVTLANAAATKVATSATNGNIIAIIAYTAATKAAAAAQWLFEKAMLATPTGLVVAGVLALVAGLVALVAWMQKSNGEYKAQRQEVEALGEKQDALNTSIAESAKAHQDNMASISGAAQAGANLLGTLQGMVDANGRVIGSYSEAAVVIDDLNAAYEGLNLSCDEQTGLLSSNTAEIERYIQAKDAVAKMDALDERRVQLLGEQGQLEANLAEPAEKRKLIEEDANIPLEQKRRLLLTLDGTINDYQADYDALGVDIAAVNNAIENSTDAMADTTINRYEAINGARDADGRNLKQLAKLYGITTDQILDDMEAQGISMTEWSTRKAGAMTEEGLSLEQLAAKWGMTTDEVKSYMDEWGMTLDEFGEEMEATHTKAGLSLDQLAAKWGTTTAEIQNQLAMQGISLQEWSDNQDAKTQEAINSFKEIPAEYEQTAGEMTEILNRNAERYGTWSQNIATLSKTMSADSIAELKKLGPEANSVLEEMIADPSKAAAFEESVLAVMSAGAGGAEIGAEDPRFAEAGETANANIGGGLENSDEAVNAAQTVVDGVTGKLRGMVAAARDIAMQAMSGMIAGLSAGQAALYAKADSIASEIIRRLEKAFDINSPSRVMMHLFAMVARGMVQGLAGEESLLYRQVDSMGEGILSRLSAVPSDLAASFNREMSLALAANQLAVTAPISAGARATALPQQAPAPGRVTLVNKNATTMTAVLNDDVLFEARENVENRRGVRLMRKVYAN